MSTFRPNSSSNNSPESEQVSEKNNVIEFPKPKNAVGVGGIVAKVEPQKETISVTVTGIQKDSDAQPVEQKLALERAQGTQDGEAIAFTWQRIRALGGIVFDDGPRKATFFPLENFQKITIEVGVVSGVTLA